MSDGLPWAVIPLKAAQYANTRLRSVLTSSERHDLFGIMLSDVLHALKDATQLGGVLAVTRCPIARHHLSRSGAMLIEGPEEIGLNAAVTHAACLLNQYGTDSFLTNPGDIPGVTGKEIDNVAGLLNKRTRLILVPARDGQGTNCLAMDTSLPIKPHFGPYSINAHVAEARHKNIQAKLLSLPGFGCDIDQRFDSKGRSSGGRI